MVYSPSNNPNEYGSSCNVMQRLFPAILLFITAATANALIVTNEWVPIFKGIDHTTARMIPDAVDPRLQAVNALRIDLSDPALQIFTHPPFTTCPLGFGYQ